MFTKWGFLNWVKSSIIVATSATILSLLVSTLAAFSFSRLRWRGRNVVFIIILAAMLIPWQVNAIPLYFMMDQFHLLDTYPGVFLPIVSMPIGTFLLRQFFINIPRSLDDAARIDGCGSWGVLWHVILPISRPALGAMAIYMFIYSWNQFLWPYIALSSESKFTLPIGLKTLLGAHDIRYGLFMAGAFLASLPALIAFLILQKRIIEGITMASIQK